MKDELPDDTRMSRLAPHLPFDGNSAMSPKSDSSLYVYINKERSTFLKKKKRDENESRWRRVMNGSALNHLPGRSRHEQDTLFFLLLLLLLPSCFYWSALLLILPISHFNNLIHHLFPLYLKMYGRRQVKSTVSALGNTSNDHYIIHIILMMRVNQVKHDSNFRENNKMIGK